LISFVCSIDQINKETHKLVSTNEKLNQTLAKSDAEKFVDLIKTKENIRIYF